MAQHNLTKLASQGRAYDETRVWTEKELEALITLETACGLTRVVAASYVRNGILTVAAYNKAKEAGFAPKSLEDLRVEAIAAYSEKVRSDLGLDTEEVVEPTEVVETEEVISVPTATVVEPEEVIEPTEVVETEEPVVEEKKSKNKGGK